MKFEVKSRETGKIIYSFDGEISDWNAKKKALLLGWDDDNKLISHIEKYGMADFIVTGVVEEVEETEIDEPEFEDVPKKRGRPKR